MATTDTISNGMATADIKLWVHFQLSITAAWAAWNAVGWGYLIPRPPVAIV